MRQKWRLDLVSNSGSALDGVHRQAPREVSLYLSCMSAPVSRMVRITLSSEMKCWPSPRSHLRRVDGLHRGDRVALDTGYLDQPANRVAGQPEVVFQTDLGSVLDLRRGGAEDFRQAGGGHRAGRADSPWQPTSAPEIEAFFLHRMPRRPAGSRRRRGPGRRD